MPYPTPAASYVRLLSHYGSTHFGFAQEYGPFGGDAGEVNLPVTFAYVDDMVEFLDDLIEATSDEDKYSNQLILAVDTGGFASWTVLTDSGNEYKVRLDIYVGL